ncbi:hypothetical protein C6W93_01025 [Mycobacterium kansasii]|nr:hypothetical protein [Mycobacterium kansasii]
MASLRMTEVDPVDRSPNHHASGSVETSSSRSRSASVRACLIHTSRSSRCSARRMTSKQPGHRYQTSHRSGGSSLCEQ